MLVYLNDEYKRLNPGGIENLPKNKEKSERNMRNLIERGKLLIDFYENTFKKKYSGFSEEIFKDADITFNSLSYMAKESIEKENYFGLAVLLTSKGDKNTDPNHLERLIYKIKEE